jgi:hypothetical protein
MNILSSDAGVRRAIGLESTLRARGTDDCLTQSPTTTHHIGTLYDVGQQDGIRYLDMDSLPIDAICHLNRQLSSCLAIPISEVVVLARIVSWPGACDYSPRLKIKHGGLVCEQ